MSKFIVAFGYVWGRTALVTMALALSMNFASSHVLNIVKPLSMNY
jgi:hypothetical protein